MCEFVGFDRAAASVSLIVRSRPHPFGSNAGATGRPAKSVGVVVLFVVLRGKRRGGHPTHPCLSAHNRRS